MTEAPDRLKLGDTRLIFLKNDKGQPSTGSALDHLKGESRQGHKGDRGHKG